MNQRHRRTITTLLLIISAAALLVGCNAASEHSVPADGRSLSSSLWNANVLRLSARSRYRAGHPSRCACCKGQQRVFALG